MVSSTVPVILASQSPRRAALLNQIGLQFTVQPSAVAEHIDPASSYEDNVKRLSLHKAEAIASQHQRAIVIGSDTIVVINGTVLEKPESKIHAAEMLRMLSGRTHTVYTGFALVDAETKKSYIDVEHTDVTFHRLTEEEISKYVASGSPMDKAGGYGIQDDFGAVFVKAISGDYYTIVGFPLAKFYRAFSSFVSELGYRKESHEQKN